MGAEDDHWLGERGQVHMGVTTNFFTLLGSAYGLVRKKVGDHEALQYRLWDRGRSRRDEWQMDAQ